MPTTRVIVPFKPLIFASGAASVLTGSTALTTMATIALPANTLGPNGVLRVTPLWSTTSNANAKTLQFLIDAVAISNFSTANNASFHDQFSITCRNSQQSQVGRGVGSATAFGTGVANATFTVDFSQAHTITIKGQLAVSTDTLTLESYLIEVLNP